MHLTSKLLKNQKYILKWFQFLGHFLAIKTCNNIRMPPQTLK